MLKLDFNQAEQEKLNRLCHTMQNNRRLMRLYSAYLSDTPCLVSKEMVEELCSSCGVFPAYAYASCLSAFFGLDTEHSAEDRRFEREYLFPSVKQLDPKKYTENPYYRSIRMPESETQGNWELRQETYPACRAFVCGGPCLSASFLEYPQIGFFMEPFRFPAVLENGNEWMTLTPVDLDTAEEAISDARGKALTFGLGLGYFAFMASQKECVHTVTVVERSPDVIRLFQTYILPQFPHKEKIRIVCADAFEYAEHVMPQEHFDTAFVDTWRDVSDGLPMYLRMKRLECYSPHTKFSYWIEDMILSHLRDIVFESFMHPSDDEESLFSDENRKIKTCEALKELLSDAFLRKNAPFIHPLADS